MICHSCRRAVRYVETLRAWGHTEARTGRGHYIRPVIAAPVPDGGMGAAVSGGPAAIFPIDTPNVGGRKARRSTT